TWLRTRGRSKHISAFACRPCPWPMRPNARATGAPTTRTPAPRPSPRSVPGTSPASATVSIPARCRRRPDAPPARGGARPPAMASSRRPGVGSEPSVEALSLRRHVAQELGRGKARALAGEALADLHRLAGADHVEPGEGPARPGREAPAEDRADIAFADVGEYAFLQSADGLQHLHQHQPVLHLGEVRLGRRHRPEARKTLPEPGPAALLVIGVKTRVRLSSEPSLVGHGEKDRIDRLVGIGSA